MAQDKATFSWHDYDGEPSNMTINLDEVTAANLDATATAVTALRTAANALTIGVIEQATITDNIWDTLAPTTDPFGQREIKWVIIAQDTAGNKFKSNELPTADLSILEGGSPYIIKNGVVAVTGAAAEVTAFKTAYEAAAKSNNGLALSIIDMYHVGRNS